MNLVKALLGELLDCHCYAQDRFECGCDTVWPIQVTDDAADEIERLQKIEAAARNLIVCGQYSTSAFEKLERLVK